MSNKIIFIDIDGTLVEAHKSVSALNIEAIDKARKKGHIVFLCTGRNRCSLTSDVAGVIVDGMICSAGSYIEINNQSIYHSYIDTNVVNNICAMMEENGVHFSLESSECSFFSKAMAKAFALECHNGDIGSLNDTIEEIYQDMCGVDMDSYDNHGIHKISFIAKDKDMLDAIVRKYSSDFNFIYHDLFGDTNTNGEMILKTDNKATGIQKVLGHLNIDHSCTIGIGDSMNDYEMLNYVKFSIAMESAPEILKVNADFIAKHASEDAIYWAFVDLGII